MLRGNRFTPLGYGSCVSAKADAHSAKRQNPTVPIRTLTGAGKRRLTCAFRSLTRTRSATAGEGAHGGGMRGSSHVNLGRTPASGWLHRMVRRFGLWLHAI